MESDAGRSARPPRRGAAIAHVLAAALALTLLNALKPLTVDDPAYYWHAQQIARAPLDPYGGEMFFREVYGPAVENVAPPVLVYWLALGLRVTGDHPVLLKLWLFPFALLLAGAVSVLLRRFARGLEGHGVWLVALSPAILPSFNLMLDLPALALSLAATTLFLRAADRDSLRLALAAGMIAGLASQTKYTGLTAAAVILAAGAIRGRMRLAVVACATAALMFVGWEAWVQGRYGVSQLLFFVGRRVRGETGPENLLDLVRPLVRMVGPLASPLIPLALLGLGARRGLVIGAMALVVAAHLALAFTPDAAMQALARPTGGRLLNLYNLTLGWLGPVVVLACAAVWWRLDLRRRESRATGRLDLRWRGEHEARFLTAWLAIEVLAYLTLSTFPAVRRALGVLVVLTLLVCRLASRAARLAEWRRRLVPSVAALAVALGLVYFAADLDDAWAERRTVERVRRQVAERGADGTIWYLGTHWGGFQFYAPRAGLEPVIPGRSWLSRDDWLVIPWNVVVRNRLTLADTSVNRMVSLPWEGRLPLATRDAFYLGSRPIRRPVPTWEAAVLYRVRESGRLVGVQPHPYRR